MNQLAEKIGEYLISSNNLNVDDSQKLLFSLKVLIGELSKFIILLAAFSFFRMGKEFFFAVIALLLIRTFTGGLHFKTYTGCLVFTTFFFGASLASARFFPFNTIETIIIAISISFLLAIFSPVVSKNRPVYSSRKLFAYKIIGISIVLIHCGASLITTDNQYLTHAIWVYIFQTIQIIVAKGRENYEKVHEKILSPT